MKKSWLFKYPYLICVVICLVLSVVSGFTMRDMTGLFPLYIGVPLCLCLLLIYFLNRKFPNPITYIYGYLLLAPAIIIAAYCTYKGTCYQIYVYQQWHPKVIHQETTPDPFLAEVTTAESAPPEQSFGEVTVEATVEEPPATLSFFKDDWEMDCDNTLTCRAAGYQNSESDKPVSILITREPGLASSRKVEIKLASDGSPEMNDVFKKAMTVSILINHQDKGSIALKEGHADLSEVQGNQIMQGILNGKPIDFAFRSHTWELSTLGAKETLSEMDKFQKGKNPLAVAEIKIAPLASAQKDDDQLLTKYAKKFDHILKATDDCSNPDEEKKANFALHRLTPSRFLLEAACWQAAYNSGSAFWIIDDLASDKMKAKLVTSEATDFEASTIKSTNLGRGLGDCWFTKEWVWNGSDFVLSHKARSGMCRLFEGGAWNIPLFVAKITH